MNSETTCATVSTTFEKIYRAEFDKCSLEDRARFPKSSCILPISIMGRKEHECGRFAATLKLVNKHFRECTLLIVDTLYRHTLKIGRKNSNIFFEEEAMKCGDAWLERNQCSIDQLTIPYKILRWDYYRNHPSFQKNYDLVINAYKTDNKFYNAFFNNAQAFLNRRMEIEENWKGEDFSVTGAFDLCLEYLKEECAGMIIWAEEDYDFDVYPTGRSEALAKNYEELIIPSYPDKIKPVGIRIKPYKSNLTNVKIA